MSLLPEAEAASSARPRTRDWKRNLGARFSALRHRNFRLFWTGHAISVVGTWMQSVALYWLMYRLTHSPFLLGLTGVALTLPILAFSLLGGVVADRADRRRLVRVTQTLNLLQAAALAAHVTFGHPTPATILPLAFANGLVNAFDFPGRQSFLSELVPAEKLPNAIALNSMVFNAARLVGPAVAGVVLVRAGEAACFWLNAVSFVPLLWNLSRMDLPPRARGPQAPAHVRLVEGVRYALETPRIRFPLTLMAVAGTLGFQYVVLMPIYAGTLLHAGARGYSLLVSASGLGAVLGTLTLTARLDRPGLRRALFIGLSAFGMGLVAFSYSRLLWLSVALSFVVGFGMILYAAGTNTLLQTAVRDEFRGRVMSFFTLMLVGTAPIGSFLMGAVADRLGAPAATRLSGMACILGALWLWHRLRAVARREMAAAAARVAGAAGLAILLAAAPARAQDLSTTDSAYVAGIERWRAEREANLRKPDGWFSLAGLFWLEPGANSFGSSRANRLVFPAGKAPERAGDLVLSDGRVTLRAREGAGITVGDRRARTLALLADTDSGGPTTLALGSLRFHVIRRGERVGVRLKDLESPALAAFKGIERYPIDPGWRVSARFEPYDPPREIEVPNFTGDVNRVPSPGAVLFERGGRAWRLDAMEEGDELFFVFADSTTGRGTYGGGRFLYSAQAGADGLVELDFNRAYNPPCAFTPFATCPLPPAQNRLGLWIEAGERDYAGAGHGE